MSVSNETIFLRLCCTAEIGSHARCIRRTGSPLFSPEGAVQEESSGAYIRRLSNPLHLPGPLCTKALPASSHHRDRLIIGQTHDLSRVKCTKIRQFPVRFRKTAEAEASAEAAPLQAVSPIHET